VEKTGSGVDQQQRVGDVFQLREVRGKPEGDGPFLALELRRRCSSEDDVGASSKGVPHECERGTRDVPGPTHHSLGALLQACTGTGLGGGPRTVAATPRRWNRNSTRGSGAGGVTPRRASTYCDDATRAPRGNA
jgi:hypothetical protein